MAEPASRAAQEAESLESKPGPQEEPSPPRAEQLEAAGTSVAVASPAGPVQEPQADRGRHQEDPGRREEDLDKGEARAVAEARTASMEAALGRVEHSGKEDIGRCG